MLTWLIKNIGVSVAFGKSLDNLREIGKVISEEEFSVMSCGFDELNCNTSARVMPILINQATYAIYLAFHTVLELNPKMPFFMYYYRSLKNHY